MGGWEGRREISGVLIFWPVGRYGTCKRWWDEVGIEDTD